MCGFAFRRAGSALAATPPALDSLSEGPRAALLSGRQAVSHGLEEQRR